MLHSNGPTTAASGADDAAVAFADDHGAERGRPAGSKSGQLLTARGFSGVGVPQAVVASPGCWTLMNIVVWSGVVMTPVISQPRGPTRNRRRASLYRMAHGPRTGTLLTTGGQCYRSGVAADTTQMNSGRACRDVAPAPAALISGRPGWGRADGQREHWLAVG
jgi:hypothetical protein